MERVNAKGIAKGTSCCLCLAFLLALFATVTPYWLYRPLNGTNLGTGGFVVSANSAHMNSCGRMTDYPCDIGRSWSGYSAYNNTLCQNADMYNKIGQYGFCTGSGGNFKTPAPVKNVQGLAVSATIALFLSAVMGFVSPAIGKNFGGCAAIFALTGCVCAAAAFSVVLTFQYYKTLVSDEGGYLALVATAPQLNCGGSCVVLSPQVSMSFGPSFWSMVTAFIISIVSAVVMLISSRFFEESDIDDEDQGAFGSGLSKPSQFDYQYHAHEAPPLPGKSL
mmetsp:Transcript_20757/g.33848  ORF Transcript_20757/g.33848 Transcript_20757/m.33848 type:complete len:278 (+) Transcript_20757:289-1122(+)|eukprot:CAMPEP_0203752414 /NCGR_PEP_ID=MMETSP0098-20131031/6354_1 /ASSEMBLY_ACC=CAM_ASM_000208 /TAXON_ID=96639 /ORGANISM=" , Strain NY0313808BC1" /LENGTH=277 /DNA_ID=CAMNT_0050642579 /DNA_START=168 /DNA_END=1001 /DNA_ORIENTATION=-